MALDPELIRRTVREAHGPIGLKDLIRRAGLHPGQQTEIKRVLRELVRSGALLREGKRFREPGGARSSAPRPQHGQEALPPTERSFAEGRRMSRHERVLPGEPPQRGERTSRGGAHAGARGHGRARGEEIPPGTWHRANRSRTLERHDREPEGRRPARQPRGRVVEGVLAVKREGIGFVKTDSGEEFFVPEWEARKALDNDRVRLELDERGPRVHARVIDVVDRRREQAVGTYLERSDGTAIVVPRDSMLPGPIRVPPTQIARSGDVVRVRLGVGKSLLPGEELVGEVSGSLGEPGAPSQEVLSIAFSEGFSDQFPAAVMDEADRVSLEVSEEARADRQDLRKLPLVTIDGIDARDFDDAVYAERTEQGFRLWVAIADVTHYVREGSPLDQEALKRATSVYLPDRVLPMLPERLSNGICSLRPDEDRLCLVAEMQIDRKGQRHGSEIYPAVMRSHARCTYEEVQAVLDGQSVPHRDRFREQFQILAELAKVLHAMRTRRGAIDFDLPEVKVEMGEKGFPARMVKRERKESHRLIEECMLAANEAVASFFHERGLPTVYRFHGEPDEEKIATFVEHARMFGFRIGRKGEVSSKELNDFIQKLSGHPEQRALNQMLLRSMMQAVYSASDVGHYGLAAQFYLHFTSPIRRYPDLVVHRLLKKHWGRSGRHPSNHELERESERLAQIAEQSSERERAAMQVEREVVSFYSALMMKDRVGEEFEATVSGVTDFGFFVELDQEHIEGLVKLESLGFGGHFDERKLRIVFPDGRQVRVGEKVKVRLASVNLGRRQIDFDAVEVAGHPVAGAAREERAGEFERPRQGHRRGREAPARAEEGRPQRPGRFPSRAEILAGRASSRRSGGEHRPGGKSPKGKPPGRGGKGGSRKGRR